MDKFVISVGRVAELLWLREAVLKAAGFRVLSFADEKQALAQIRTVDCRVLLLCYSIPAGIRQQLAKKFRAACPSCCIVTITNAPLQHPPVEADTVLYGVEGAEALIAAVTLSIC